jgi:squalene synthase HpnC
MAVEHYENFPVASLLLPRHLRVPVTDIYRFARSADDIADEGDASPSERLARLQAYQTALEQIRSGGLGESDDEALMSVFAPLATTISRFSLPLEPFFDLLSAFSQDVSTQRYADDAALFDYCRRSANPVGRLMLHLYGAVTPQNVAQSDAVCTGLQLTNFWQDIAIDWQKNRVYLPQAQLSRHAISESFIAEQAAGGMADATLQSRGWQTMMREQVDQARQLLLTGIPLTRRLPGRIGLEIRMVIHGGLRILERLDALHYDMFQRRPTLNKKDWALLLWRSIA